MANYLITGGAGFIGSRIARSLLSRGDNVTIIDNLKTGKKENIPVGSQFILSGIEDQATFKKIPSLHYDAVLHLAAQSSGEISHDDPIYDLESNAKGTLNTLLWAQNSGIQRFLNASSMGVYGEVSSSENPVTETRCPHPLSFYGVSKTTGEHYSTYFVSKGMKITSFRMFNVYGPGQNLENLKQGMVSIYLAYILKNEPIIVKGSKYRFRDFIFIDDVVNAWIASIDNPSTFNQVYNLATGKKTQVYELINSLLNAFSINPESYPVTYAESTPGDQTGIYANISKLQNDLNWNPKVSLDDGLKKLAATFPQLDRFNNLG